jgi:filamentous hemagglutinin family protein
MTLIASMSPWLSPSIALALTLTLIPGAAIAQITPDATTGSTITPDTIRGLPSDRIGGGAIRAGNLFHSFTEFNVPEGRGAYFENPTGIQNIFSRVTGGNPSNILGTLGVLGSANLFFINPNGIVFGPNASLDVQGSFISSTAHAIQFGNLGEFSALRPDVPSPLLTVNPSALLFNQIPIGNLALNSRLLGVLANQSLLLVGGNISLNGGGLVSPGGQIAVGGLSQPGAVSLVQRANQLGLQFPTDVNWANVDLTSGARIAAVNGGDITVTANRLSLGGGAFINTNTNSAANAGNIQIQAQDAVELGDRTSIISNTANPPTGTIETVTGNLGNIQIDTRQLISNGGFISAITNGRGNGGDVTIRASDSIQATGGILGSLTTDGTGGNLLIDTGTLTFINPPGQQSGILVTTTGAGNSGSVTIRARDRITLTGANIFTTLLGSATGQAGNITLTTGQLQLQAGASITASTNTGTSAGNITIQADDISISGIAIVEPNGERGFLQSGIFSEAGTNARGNAGTLTLDTNRLSLSQGGTISTTTVGSGNGGNLILRARDSIELSGWADLPNGLSTTGRIAPTQIDSSTLGDGNGGDTTLETGRLLAQDGAQITTSTLGSGNAGKLTVHADDIELRGQGPSRRVDGPPTFSGLFAEVQTVSTGEGADLTVTAQQLRISDGARISTATFNQGNGGNLNIHATQVAVDNGIVSTEVGDDGRGNAGTLTLEADQIALNNGGQINSSTSGIGNAGEVTVRGDRILIQGADANNVPSGIFANVDNTAQGTGGNLTIAANHLSLLQGGTISTTTRGRGNAGSIAVTANNNLTLDGFNAFGVSSGIFARSAQGAQGRGGDITLATGTLRLTNGAIINARTDTADPGGTITLNANTLTASNGGQIVTTTGSTGSAGDIILNSPTIRFSGSDRTYANRLTQSPTIADTSEGPTSGVFASTRPNSSGNGGTITLNTNRLSLSDGAQLSAATSGTGNPGNINVREARTIRLNNSIISTAINPGVVLQTPTANQGTINLQTRSLSLTNRANITASTSGTGDAGDIVVRNARQVSLNDSTLSTAVNRNASGRGGNITLRTDTLNLDRQARISAQTRGQGRAGNIRVNAEQLTLANGGRFITSTTSRRAGNITLTSDRLQITGDRSGILANTNAGSTGRGGDVTITGTDITLTDGGAISAQTQGRGRAGDVQLTAQGDLTLNNRANISAASQLPAHTTRDRNPQVTLGRSGDITLHVNGALRATDSTITTQSQQAAGGAIAIQAGNIRLQDNSDIRTDVAQGANRGGDITLTARSILAFDDSDILAFARDGQGGNVTLATPAFFGERYQPAPAGTNPATLDGNDRVDVNASGRVRSGTVQVPDTTFIQNNLSQLPETAIDADRLIASSCITRSGSNGSFWITGSGALPERPNYFLLSPYPTGTVRSPLEERSPTPQHQGWQPGEAIIEPQGAYTLPNGRIVLSRECSSANEQ